jgi:hypothetical protein
LSAGCCSGSDFTDAPARRPGCLARRHGGEDSTVGRPVDAVIAGALRTGAPCATVIVAAGSSDHAVDPPGEVGRRR